MELTVFYGGEDVQAVSTHAAELVQTRQAVNTQLALCLSVCAYTHTHTHNLLSGPLS
jgi:hypothetical protein